MTSKVWAGWFTFIVRHTLWIPWAISVVVSRGTFLLRLYLNQYDALPVIVSMIADITISYNMTEVYISSYDYVCCFRLSARRLWRLGCMVSCDEYFLEGRRSVWAHNWMCRSGEGVANLQIMLILPNGGVALSWQGIAVHPHWHDHHAFGCLKVMLWSCLIGTLSSHRLVAVLKRNLRLCQMSTTFCVNFFCADRQFYHRASQVWVRTGYYKYSLWLQRCLCAFQLIVRWHEGIFFKLMKDVGVRILVWKVWSTQSFECDSDSCANTGTIWGSSWCVYTYSWSYIRKPTLIRTLVWQRGTQTYYHLLCSEF